MVISNTTNPLYGNRDRAQVMSSDSTERSANSPFASLNNNAARTKGRALAGVNQIEAASLQKQPTENLKPLDIVSTGWKLGMKGVRALCLIGGFLGASASVLSMFFFNIKSLGILFGIPAALFLYTATHLGKETKDESKTIAKDPLTGLKVILEQHPEFLRIDPKFVIKTIQSVGNVKRNDPQYYEILDRLEALKEAVIMEQAQLQTQLQKNNDPATIAYHDFMADYLTEIEMVQSLDPNIKLAPGEIEAHEMQRMKSEVQKSIAQTADNSKLVL